MCSQTHKVREINHSFHLVYHMQMACRAYLLRMRLTNALSTLLSIDQKLINHHHSLVHDVLHRSNITPKSNFILRHLFIDVTFRFDEAGIKYSRFMIEKTTLVGVMFVRRYAW